MLNKPTGVQSNDGHRLTDEHITRTYIMPLLFDDETRRRLIAEHRANPVGSAPRDGRPAIEHSLQLRTLLDKMRRHDMAGKYVSVCVRPFAEFRIGVSSGVRGQPVEMFDERFSSEEACEHGIFLKRITDLMSQYG